MKHTLYVLETSKKTFITIDHVGKNHLHASDIEEFYLAQMFDTEEEVDTYEELLNTGTTGNPHIRPHWQVTVDKELIPVKKRTVVTELLPS